MLDEIPNADLVLEHVPSADADWFEIEEFALTFDGYKAHGSFDACAQIANNRLHNTLTNLRTCLFFEQRRWRHFGENPDDEAMKYIRSLVEQIRSTVMERDNTQKR
jgi:hypothetical protein